MDDEDLEVGQGPSGSTAWSSKDSAEFKERLANMVQVELERTTRAYTDVATSIARVDTEVC